MSKRLAKKIAVLKQSNDGLKALEIMAQALIARGTPPSKEAFKRLHDRMVADGRIIAVPGVE